MARSKHTCGILRVSLSEWIVVVAGGTGNVDNILKTVETLSVTDIDIDNNEQWEFGPQLPIPTSEAASAMSTDEQRLFVIGGTTNIGRSDSIFRLHCSNIVQCSWTILDLELRMPSAGLALVLPPTPMVSRGYANTRTCPEGKVKQYILPLYFNNSLSQVLRMRRAF